MASGWKPLPGVVGMNTCQRRSNRGGFTLIELLIVMTTIALLSALLIPAYASVRNRVRVAQVTMDIAAIGSGLVEVKTEYGAYPPSKFTVWEFGNATMGTGWFSDNRSLAYARSAWPSIDFELPHDFNNDGDTNDSFVLNGSEAMVFFLGGRTYGHEDANRNGVIDPGEDANGNGKLDWGACVGFSKKPSDPLAIPTTGEVGKRFYAIDTGRLVDVNNNGWPEMVDTIPGQRTPYAYLAAPYNPADAALIVDFEGTPMASQYLKSATVSWDDSRFQMISPGFDERLGTGGIYDPTQPQGGIPDTRISEWDNIADFSNGLLGGG